MMNCNDTTRQLHGYFDHELDDIVSAEIEAHLEACDGCRRLYTREQGLRLALRQLRTQAPDPARFDGMIEHAAALDEHRHRNRWMAMGFGGAIAAGLAGWLALGLFVSQPQQPDTPEIAGLTISLHETRTVNLVFNSSSELRDAVVSLQLPPGFEIAGFPGQREVRWTTTVRQGENLLTLPLIAKQRSGGELLALVEHGSKRKTFRLRLTVGPDENALYLPRKPVTA